MFKRYFIIFFIVFTALNLPAMFDKLDVTTQTILQLISMALLPIFLIKVYIDDKSIAKRNLLSMKIKILIQYMKI